MMNDEKNNCLINTAFVDRNSRYLIEEDLGGGTCLDYLLSSNRVLRAAKRLLLTNSDSVASRFEKEEDEWEILRLEPVQTRYLLPHGGLLTWVLQLHPYFEGHASPDQLTICLRDLNFPVFDPAFLSKQWERYTSRRYPVLFSMGKITRNHPVLARIDKEPSRTLDFFSPVEDAWYVYKNLAYLQKPTKSLELIFRRQQFPDVFEVTGCLTIFHYNHRVEAKILTLPEFPEHLQGFVFDSEAYANISSSIDLLRVRLSRSETAGRSIERG